MKKVLSHTDDFVLLYFIHNSRQVTKKIYLHNIMDISVDSSNIIIKHIELNKQHDFISGSDVIFSYKLNSSGKIKRFEHNKTGIVELVEDLLG